MNVEHILMKQYEATSFASIGDAPPSALQGLAARADEPLKQIGIGSVMEMGQLIFYKRAKAIVNLASFEEADGRAASSAMHLEDIVKKKDSKALLSVLADSPCSVLKGVTAKVEKTLAESLQIKTVRDLAQNKFFTCAESLSVLADTKTGKEPTTPSRALATPSRPADVRSPGQVSNLQLEDYKNTLQSLNERLKFYIDEIRARDETITELNAQLYQAKHNHVTQMDQLDAQYKTVIKEMEGKVDTLHHQELQRLEASVSKAQADLEKELKRSAAAAASVKQLGKEREAAAASHAAAAAELEEVKAARAKEVEQLEAVLVKARADLEKESAKAAAAKATAKAETTKRAAVAAELAETAREVVELKAALEASRQALAKAEGEKSALAGGKADAETALAIQVAAVAAGEKALAHAATKERSALAEAARAHAQDTKKAREAMLLNMHKELDAQRGKLAAEHSAALTEAKAAAVKLRATLEADLRRTSAALSEAECKAEAKEREMTEFRKLYLDLKDRYEKEYGSAVVRIAELTSDVAETQSARDTLQEELGRLMGESASIMDEIERYSTLLSQEESRVGISSPAAPVERSANKRRRVEDGSDYATPSRAAGTPGPRLGLLDSVRKLTGL
eukprot:CAMPEP_0118946684 /NCGR_PEP_ID=MMETSP1169-20130426/44660_1 /TAXON_ID=36882 /ORGANISM="Pyramimonas obovata, Strain CCMP722" /LENGTH=625 /DNA_ID=CAMNT_0006892721 /DNA_START=45 /DNA_END=1922 /DNA_ORIENTATION=-